MSNNFNTPIFTREDCAREYNAHFANNSQGYYKALEKFNNALKPFVGGSAFSRESYQKILTNDALWKKALDCSSEIFHNDETKLKYPKTNPDLNMLNTIKINDNIIKVFLKSFFLELILKTKYSFIA